MTKEKATPAPEKKRLTVTIDFTDFPEMYQWINDKAEKDERTAAVWLRRLIWEQFNKVQASNVPF